MATYKITAKITTSNEGGPRLTAPVRGARESIRLRVLRFLVAQGGSLRDVRSVRVKRV